MSAKASVPSKMRAIQIKDGKGPSSAMYISDDVAVPQVKSESLLVKVKAFGLNRMDILQREGKYPGVPKGASDILGVEFSGTVASTGEESNSDLAIGDAVFGLATGGAYAEYIAVPRKMVLRKPKELSDVQAAAIPECWLTAFQALTLLSEMKSGEDVLIHAGASSVGLAAIQIALQRGARRVFVTAGADEKCRFCESLGATKAFNYKQSDWKEELSKASNGEGVDVIMDFIGASYFAANMASLKTDGRFVIQGTMGGSMVKEFNLRDLMIKRARIQASMLRVRSLDYQSELVQNFLKEGGLDLLIQGAQEDGQKSKSGPGHTLAIHKVFPWEDIAAAHEEMQANKNIGKIVVTIDG